MVNIDQARKTLGKKADNMTDQQVQTVINSLTRLAEMVIDQVVNKVPNDNSLHKKETK